MHFVYCNKSQPLLHIRRPIVSPPVANIWHSVFCLYSFFYLEVITSVKGCAGDASLQYCTLLPEHKYALAEVYLAPCLGLSSLSSQMLSLVRSFALWKLYLSRGSLCVLKGISPDWVWLFLGAGGFSGGCSHVQPEGIRHKTSGVFSADSRETGACHQCTCVAGKVVESQGVSLFCCQRTVERLTGGSDE